MVARKMPTRGTTKNVLDGSGNEKPRKPIAQNKSGFNVRPAAAWYGGLLNNWDRFMFGGPLMFSLIKQRRSRARVARAIDEKRQKTDHNLHLQKERRRLEKEIAQLEKQHKKVTKAYGVRQTKT